MDEYENLRNMQVIDREVFFYLCQRTDKETGFIGIKTRVSRSGIALDLSERPEPGRGVRPLWVITSDQVKDSILRLVKAGLLRPHSEAKKKSALVVSRVFFEKWLQRDRSVKKEVPQRFPDKLPESESEIINANNKLEEYKPPASPVGTGEVPRTRYISSTTTDGGQFSMTLDWQPTESELRAILFRAVGGQTSVEALDPAWIADFVAYWSSNIGRQYSQSQWTMRFAQDVIRYVRDPEFAARKFGGAGSAAKGEKRAVDVGSKSLPDWARLPKSDDELIGWSRRHGYGDADSGDGWQEFRAKLKIKINRRLAADGLAKVSW